VKRKNQMKTGPLYDQNTYLNYGKGRGEESKQAQRKRRGITLLRRKK